MPDKKLTDSEIVKALEMCIDDNLPINKCEKCPATKECDKNPFHALEKPALDLINRLQAEKEELQELVNEMSDYFPACIGCEGKTEDDVRTDKCVFLIDKTNYCVKRGISNIVAIRKENAELKADIERLQEEIELLHSDYTYKFVKAKAKAEAYKECIEKVKELFPKEDWFTREALDNLLKELVGGDNEQSNT